MREGRSTAIPFAVGLLLALPAVAAFAQAPDGLYTARVLTTGQGEENRPAALARGLSDVLVKVSGDAGLAGDPRVAALDPAAFVAALDYRDLMAGIPVHDEQGTRQRPYELTITFDSRRIDAALAGLGETPWTEKRPTIAAFIAVRNGDLAYGLTRDGAHGIDQRDSLAAAAWGAGLPLVLPATASPALAGFSADTFAATDPAALDAGAIGGDVALSGSLTWTPAMLGWPAEWRLSADGRSHRWQRANVSFDAAFRSGMRGAATILSGHGDPD
jgi:hypothetical protein